MNTLSEGQAENNIHNRHEHARAPQSISRLPESSVRNFKDALATVEEPTLKGKEHSYVIKSALGRGGMGEVWKAQRDDGKLVAIKIIRPEMLRSNNDENRERLIQEGLILEEIDGIHFPQFLEADEAGTTIVMEYVEGHSLASEIVSGKISVLDAAIIGAEVAEGMNHAHKKGYVHRDLKPENIMVTADRSQVKILDFGSAYLLAWKREQKSRGTTGRITLQDVTIGTHLYTAPEIFYGNENDIRAPVDVYSLGIVLYQMLSKGKLPYTQDILDARGQQQYLKIITRALDAQYEYPRLERIRPELPKQLTDLVARMLSYDASTRPTMEYVQDQLRDFIFSHIKAQEISETSEDIRDGGDTTSLAA